METANNQNDQQRYNQTTVPTSWKTQLQNAITHVRQYWLRYFVVLLAAVLIISAIITVITPTPPEEQPVDVAPISSSVVEAPSSVNVVFANRDIELPATLPLYRGTATAQDAGELTASLAEQLGIPKDPSPYLDNVWTNYQTNEQIRYQAASGQITYRTFEEAAPTNQEPAQTTGEPFNTEEAIAAAEQFLTQLPNFPELTPQTKQISYLYDEAAVETSSAAQIIVIPFDFRLNNYPVFFAGARKSYAEFQVDKSYQVTQAVFFPPPPTPEGVGERSTKSLDAAAEEIAAGQATAIAAGSRTGEITVSELSQLRITKTTIEYRYDPNNNSYLPYFRFAAEGTSQNQAGPTSFTLILPAIATTNTDAATNPTQN